jgi:predicted GNAT family N-acyltransferase
MLEVRQITAVETIPLRQAVLRPGRPAEDARFPGDEAADTVHFGAFRDGKLLCIASLFLTDFPNEPGLAAYQLRGMATAPEARNSGLGNALARACVDFARTKAAQLLWCNARTSAAGFYLKLGFKIIGPEFEILDVGPHVRMQLRLHAD